MVMSSASASAMFNFHRLDVYRCAITFLSLAAPLAVSMLTRLSQD